MRQGKALDITQTAPVDGLRRAASPAPTDYEDIAGSDVVIITAGVPRKPGMRRDDLLDINLEDHPRRRRRTCKSTRPNAFVIVVSNPLDAMVYALKKVTGFPRDARGRHGRRARHRALPVLRRRGARRARVKDMDALVLGGHGDTWCRCSATAPSAASRSPSSSPRTSSTRSSSAPRNGGGEIVELMGTERATTRPRSARDRDGRDATCKDQKRVLAVRRAPRGRVRQQGPLHRRAGRASAPAASRRSSRSSSTPTRRRCSTSRPTAVRELIEASQKL